MHKKLDSVSNIIEMTQSSGDAFFSVRVSPKASRAGVTGVHAGALKIAVTEPPDKGKANAAVIALLARALDIPKSRIAIQGPLTSRTKKIRVKGISVATLAKRVQDLLSSQK